MFFHILFVISVILLIVDCWKPKKFLKLHQELGNNFRQWPILGNATDFIGSNEVKMNTLIQYSAEAYKNKHKAISFWLGNSMFVVISDADQASAVLKCVLEKGYLHTFAKDLAGNGTIIAPVEFWHRRRKVLVPTFAPKHVNKFVTVFEEQNEIAAERLESKVGKGNVRCLEYFAPSALASVCGTLFVDFDVQRQPEHPFQRAFMDWFKNIASRMCQPWLHIDWIYKLLPIYTKQKRNIKTIQDFVDYLIKQKKTLMDENENNAKLPENDELKPKFKTFLELMMECSKETDDRYTDEELREEAIILSLAGTDTSAVGTSFIILLLSQHMDVQDEVYREIKEVLGDSDKPLQSEHLLKLKYTRAVIKETLRLYPPVPVSLRLCTKDVELPSGLVLPDGCNVVISTYGIQRNPEHWGEDANEFKPERFLSGQIPKPNAFMAFSYGPRNCVGQQYAMLSLTTTLVVLLRRFRFTPAENFKYDKNNPLRLSFELTMKNTDQFLVRVELRNNNSLEKNVNVNREG